MRTGKIIEADADDLAIEKGITLWIGTFDGLAAFFIEQTGKQVEPAEQFDKPLVHQGLGQYDEGTLGTAGKMEAVKDEAGLDGFPQAHFIGQQDTGM